MCKKGEVIWIQTIILSVISSAISLMKTIKLKNMMVVYIQGSLQSQMATFISAMLNPSVLTLASLRSIKACATCDSTTPIHQRRRKNMYNQSSKMFVGLDLTGRIDFFSPQIILIRCTNMRFSW